MINFKRLIEISFEINKIETDIFLNEHEKHNKLLELKNEIDKMKSPTKQRYSNLFINNTVLCLN